jgi:hypothetical protein
LAARSGELKLKRAAALLADLIAVEVIADEP